VTMKRVRRLSRMFKKAVQRGRSERKGEEVRTALCVGRSPLQWILANGKTPPMLPVSEELLLNVEPLSDARTKLADFFNIMLLDEIELDAQFLQLIGTDGRRRIG
jgi:hypothetical protein